MFNTIILCLIGLISGLLMGLAGILPLGFFIILFKFLDVGDYKTILGTVLYVLLFPLTFGSIWEFYKAKKINFFVGNILLITMVIGSYIGSKLVLDEHFQITEKTIKYITAVMTFIFSIVFFKLPLYKDCILYCGCNLTASCKRLHISVKLLASL